MIVEYIKVVNKLSAAIILPIERSFFEWSLLISGNPNLDYNTNKKKAIPFPGAASLL
jgi:hypothetical protein